MDFTLRIAPNPRKNQTKLSLRDRLRIRLVLCGGEQRTDSLEPGWLCTRVSVPRGIPHTSRVRSADTPRGGGSGSHRTKGKRGTPHKVTPPTGPDLELEATEIWTSPGLLRTPRGPRPEPRFSASPPLTPGGTPRRLRVSSCRPALAHEAAAPAAGAGAPLAVPVVMPCPATTREERRAVPPGSG